MGEFKIMINFKRIGLKNYKSFTDYAFLEGIGNVNLIIGKNNSGKSSMLDVVEYVFNKNIFSETQPEEIIVGQELTEAAIASSFSKSISGGSIGCNYYSYGSKFLDKMFSYKLLRKVDTGYDSKRVKNEVDLFEDIDGNRARPEFIRAFTNLYSTLPQGVRKVAAERNIIPEEQNSCDVLPNGIGATSVISTYLNDSKKDEKLIEKNLLTIFNEILGEDSHFDAIKVQQVEQSDKSYLWEIYLVEDGERYPLSKMGSGLKTILLVLINLLICTKEKDARVFLFEELENNLHPALQRRLFNFIYDYAIEKDILVFITSHSHVSINCYFGKESANIYHVEKRDGVSTVKKIESYLDKAELLDDLDVRASDLLQSNGIIWVEGPSDRIYIKKWLSLIDSSLKENEHYQFAYYGGRLLSHYTGNMEEDDLIKILLTNRNSAIVIDSDKRNRQANINDTKKRVQSEFADNKLFCWITKGKEIENYISARSINIAYNANLTQIGQYELFPNYICSVKDNFVTQKVRFAQELIKGIEVEDLMILDLKEKILKLANVIKKWNHL